MAEGFQIKDSGERATFSSGMIRDTEIGKTDFTTIFDGPMADRYAAHLSKAKAKYPDLPDGTPNWMQANGQAELIRFRKSAFRHFRQWLRGDRDEDHAAAVFFNINGFEYVRDRMAMAPPAPPVGETIFKLAAAEPEPIEEGQPWPSVAPGTIWQYKSRGNWGRHRYRVLGTKEPWKSVTDCHGFTVLKDMETGQLAFRTKEAETKFTALTSTHRGHFNEDTSAPFAYLWREVAGESAPEPAVKEPEKVYTMEDLRDAFFKCRDATDQGRAKAILMNVGGSRYVTSVESCNLAATIQALNEASEAGA